LAKKKTAATDPSVADKIAEFIGASLAGLLNEKDQLTKRLAQIEKEIVGVTGKVSKQLGRYVPTSLPGFTSSEGPKRGPGRPKGAARKRKPMSAETKAKMATAAKKRWAAKAKADKANE
jgi:hypothetical protein